MNTLELQHHLIKKILNISDNKLLSYLNTIISDKNNTTEYEFNEFEKEIIRESRKDYQNGNILSNDEVFSKSEKWLRE